MMGDYKRNTRIWRSGVVALLMTGLFATVAACSSDQPKPLAQPTPDQVRSHSDRTFDKLKQEEKEQTVQPPAPQ